VYNRCFVPARAGVAQLVEQLIRNQQVLGSSPSAGSRFSNLRHPSSRPIRESTTNPRQRFNDLEELAASTRTHGVHVGVTSLDSTSLRRGCYACV
jgi:hypothetical protein